MNSAPTLYAVLGVAASASREQIDAAHAALAQAAQGDADALSLLRVAHDTLRDPQRRAAYDRRLAARAEPGPALGVLSGGLAGELPPHLSRSSRPRRSPLRNWLVLVLAIGGSAAYLLLSSPPPPPPPAVLASVAPP
ncbi:MAG TPA: hypothetical protein VFY24_11445, partial [Azospira sp.]|nr:hypothetical protein [Azospira sp.]